MLRSFKERPYVLHSYVGCFHDRLTSKNQCGIIFVITEIHCEYHVAKYSPEISHNFHHISARASHIYFFILRRDRKAYANNSSYRLPSSTKN